MHFEIYKAFILQIKPTIHSKKPESKAKNIKENQVMNCVNKATLASGPPHQTSEDIICCFQSAQK